ncbi:MAG TPA: hypothetical protein VMT16_09585 [Thermoanaerobaculia bacterium]|nr:hypothetical protein [Thermoanaerobaculia bacterium]
MTPPRDDRRQTAGGTWPWVLLACLLVLHAVAVLGSDRAAWPGPIGDEATYAMQAQSLAFDGDLRYSRADYDRLVATGLQPEGLILQSGDQGARITYGKPVFYAFWAAPFVRFAPVRGFLVANLVALFTTVCVVAWSLRSTLGGRSPLCVALWVFGSVTFAYTSWIHPDLFLLCAVAVAFALACARPAPSAAGRRRAPALRWGLVGALLAMVVVSRPLYLPLLLPALVLVPRGERRGGLAALAAGVLMVTGGSLLLHQRLSGSWTSYGAERRAFYSYTGYPELDFPASQWSRSIQEWGDHSVGSAQETIADLGIDPGLMAWNSVYALVGRYTGVLPYFLPLVLGFFGSPRGAGRWSLVAATAVATAAFLWLRPFNYYGGEGAIANRYFLPLYPALWFVATRPPRWRWLALSAAGAALFVGPLWIAPRAFPLRADGTHRYVGAVAQRLLPYETTQANLKPAAREDVTHHGLWIKLLDRSLRASADGDSLYLEARSRGRLVLGSPAPLGGVTLVPAGLEEGVAGGGPETAATATRPAPRLPVALPRPRVHPMWWTREDWYLYPVELPLGPAPETVAFALHAVPTEAAPSPRRGLASPQDRDPARRAADPERQP